MTARPWGSLNPQTLAQPFADQPDYGDPPEDDEAPQPQPKDTP